MSERRISVHAEIFQWSFIPSCDNVTRKDIGKCFPFKFGLSYYTISTYYNELVEVVYSIPALPNPLLKATSSLPNPVQFNNLLHQDFQFPNQFLGSFQRLEFFCRLASIIPQFVHFRYGIFKDLTA